MSIASLRRPSSRLHPAAKPADRVVPHPFAAGLNPTETVVCSNCGNRVDRNDAYCGHQDGPLCPACDVARLNGTVREPEASPYCESCDAFNAPIADPGGPAEPIMDPADRPAVAPTVPIAPPTSIPDSVARIRVVGGMAAGEYVRGRDDPGNGNLRPGRWARVPDGGIIGAASADMAYAEGRVELVEDAKPTEVVGAKPSKPAVRRPENPWIGVDVRTLGPDARRDWDHWFTEGYGVGRDDEGGERPEPPTLLDAFQSAAWARGYLRGQQSLVRSLMAEVDLEMVGGAGSFGQGGAAY